MRKNASRQPDVPRHIIASILLLFATVAAFWFGGEIVGAQNPPATSAPRRGAASAPTPSPSPIASPSPSPEPYVPIGGVYRLGSEKSETDAAKKYGEPMAGMDNIIIVRVRNVKKLLDDANCKTFEGADKPNCEKQKIVLYLDGRAMKGLVPESGAPIIGKAAIDQKVIEASQARDARLKPQTDALKEQYKADPKKLEEETKRLLAANSLPATPLPDEGTFRFHIQRTADSDEAWADLLGSPPIFADSENSETGTLFIRPVAVSVGLENTHAIPVDAGKFSFIRVHKRWFWFVSLGLILLLIVLFVLARKTSLLRDDVEPIGENAKGKQTDERPYSLGRAQMAFWFLLIVTAFLYIFLITWQSNTVTEQALALMGISAATALGAVAVSSNKSNQSADNLQDSASRYPVLREERATLEASTKELSENVQKGVASKDERQKLTADREKLRKVKKEIRDISTVSQGFIDDLLTDIHGYSFHRFQIFVWTIVLGFIFLHGVYNRLAMPAFSATLLALLGISGVTYVGFKIPEQQEPAPTNPAQPTGNAGGGGGQGGNV